MNTLQRGRLIQLLKEYLPDSQPNDSDQTQWEIISEILNTLGPEQTTDQWKAEWETMKNTLAEKLAAIELKEDADKIPDDLKLSEEDHRVIKVCGFENESQKMANLIKMLDCRAESPFLDDSAENSENNDGNPTSPDQEENLSESINDSSELKSDAGENVAQKQLDEQMTINGQLAELLDMLKATA